MKNKKDGFKQLVEKAESCSLIELADYVDVYYNKNKDEFMNLYYGNNTSLCGRFKHDRYMFAMDYLGSDSFGDTVEYVFVIFDKIENKTEFRYIFVSDDDSISHWGS